MILKWAYISTGLGEIYQYTLESETERNNETKGNGGTRSKTVDLTELRTVQDWIIRPQLRSVRGVADINFWWICKTISGNC